MKLAVMQPYFFPYIGYWQLINAVDKFVIYDDVNFIKGGWINRNRILINKKEKMITLSLKKMSPNKLINEIEIHGKHEKLIKTIVQEYKKAPFYDDAMPVIKKILRNPETRLSSFLEFSIRIICNYIGIHSELIVSSKLDKNNALRSQEKILDICERLKADHYLNPIGGQSLYEKTAFEERGLKLSFVQPTSFIYNQRGNPFTNQLSIIDAMMFNSSTRIREEVNQYKLVFT